LKKVQALASVSVLAWILALAKYWLRACAGFGAGQVLASGLMLTSVMPLKKVQALTPASVLALDVV